MAYFPMYIELEHVRCLIAGGGQVAARKAEVLLDFGAEVWVVAPCIQESLRENPKITCLLRQFQVQDLEEAKLVVAATDDKQLNHEISLWCRQRMIPVNAVDQTEDCTFILPSYVKQGPVTAAVTSGGTSPVAAQYLKRRIEEIFPRNLGATARLLGQVRPYVKKFLDTEAQRKKVYEGLLETGLLKGTFAQEDVERFIKAAEGEMKKRNSGLEGREEEYGDSNWNQRIQAGNGPDGAGL